MAAEQLTISNLSSRARVLDAISEFDRLGRDDFLAKYGYGPSRRYRLRHDGRLYDSKAIAGVAWGLQHFKDASRRPDAYTGGVHTSVPALEKLNFEIVADTDPDPPRLQEGKTYAWEALGELFEFPPDYLGRAGGMVSRPELNSLLLITHSQEGRSFNYGDRWDGDELIYAGRGLTGHQELKAQNRQVAENSRELFLFEYAGRRQLLFHSRVRCVDYWESTGFDKEGNNRRVYRFRLRPLGERPQRRRLPKRPGPEPQGHQRDPSSFKLRPFDPDRTLAERRRSAPADPESQKVASEQADRTHQTILRTFGLWLKANEWKGLEEIDGAIDLLATPRGGKSPRVLFEIKGIRPSTERTRVRSGLAQLLEYRLFLGSPSDRLCLVSDHPIFERRLRLLDSLSIGHVYIEKGEVQISGTRASRSLFPRAVTSPAGDP